jgi:acyl-CoA synthetase (AMP-forming)/AMP-acid ligase II
MRYSLNEVLRWRRKVTPELAALWFEGKETSFAELDARTNRVAQALIASGVKRGDRVAVLDKNHDRYFELIYGISKAGAIFVPVNWRLAPPEVAHVLNDCGAELLFHGAGFAPTIGAVEAELRTVKRKILFDSYDSFVAQAPSDADPRRDLGEDETSWLFYTSGTTGKPKGVELTQGNLTCLLGVAPNLMAGMREEEVTLSFLPFFHIAGAGLLNISLMAGMKLVLLREFDPAAVLQLIGSERVNHALFVPAVIQALVHDPRSKKADFSSLRSVSYGSAPIGEETARAAIALFGCELIQLYGLTETTGAVTRLRFADHQHKGERACRLTSCGHPLIGIEARVVGESGQALSPGELGEIELKGPRIMKGYWNMPEATREALKDGWFRTGDVGFIDRDGFIYIRDRLKDLIISGGENISSLEVENCLVAHPAIAEAAVIGVPDAKWGETVKAIVVLKPGKVATAAEILEFCQGKIAAYKKPRSVDFVPALPRNAGGKVLKRELRRPFWEGLEREVN